MTSGGSGMQENYKILVVDDDMRLRALLERYLTEQGFQVRSVANAEQMDRLLTRESFHLMVLDLMLPGEDGLSICRRLRSQSNPMPIIMVTAKGEEVDRIVGLEIGADDYIPKPFNPRELLARIRAVLRRQANELPGAPSQEEAVIAFGKFKLNLGTREMFREDEPMPLTSGEFAVLKALVSHPREPLSRYKLMNLARGREYSAMERSIDVQISRLRRMVEEDPAHPRYIQTVWGLGYVFVPDGSKASGGSGAPPTDVSLGDELHLDGEDVAMAHADALDDFDLDMLGDGDSPGPGFTPHDSAPYGALDMADFEFEQMFTDALGIDEYGGASASGSTGV
nr:OmpR-OGR [Cloning vector pMSx64]